MNYTLGVQEADIPLFLDGLDDVIIKISFTA